MSGNEHDSDNNGRRKEGTRRRRDKQSDRDRRRSSAVEGESGSEDADSRRRRDQSSEGRGSIGITRSAVSKLISEVKRASPEQTPNVIANPATGLGQEAVIETVRLVASLYTVVGIAFGFTAWTLSNGFIGRGALSTDMISILVALMLLVGVSLGSMLLAAAIGFLVAVRVPDIAEPVPLSAVLAGVGHLLLYVFGMGISLNRLARSTPGGSLGLLDGLLLNLILGLLAAAVAGTISYAASSRELEINRVEALSS